LRVLSGEKNKDFVTRRFSGLPFDLTLCRLHNQSIRLPRLLMNLNIVWIDHCDGTETIEKRDTPVCSLKIRRRGDVITQVDWDFTADRIGINGQEEATFPFWPESSAPVEIKLLKQGTAHQNKVWAELLLIPQGETLTYSAIAKKIGSSPRAVGNACRNNPYTLIIPCHRVVAVNGMGGYSGHRHGEYMAIKAKLLEYEANRKTSHYDQ
jgi:methylated-DNA-[protein]-cysteine S-methyltransferase